LHELNDSRDNTTTLLHALNVIKQIDFCTERDNGVFVVKTIFTCGTPVYLTTNGFIYKVHTLV